MNNCSSVTIFLIIGQNMLRPNWQRNFFSARFAQFLSERNWGRRAVGVKSDGARYTGKSGRQLRPGWRLLHWGPVQAHMALEDTPAPFPPSSVLTVNSEENKPNKLKGGVGSWHFQTNAWGAGKWFFYCTLLGSGSPIKTWRKVGFQTQVELPFFLLKRW